MITSAGFSFRGVVCGFQVSYQKAKLCAAAGLARAAARGLVPWLDPHPTIPIERASPATNCSRRRQTRNMVHTSIGSHQTPRYGDIDLLDQQLSAAIWV